MKRSLPSRSLHLSTVYNVMYVNIVTESHIQKNSYSPPTLCQLIFLNQAGLCPNQLICTSIIHLKTFPLFSSNKIRNLIQKKILVSIVIKLDGGGSILFIMLDYLQQMAFIPPADSSQRNRSWSS